MTSTKPSSFLLTSHLRSLHTSQFTRATQSPFLYHAASGALSKPTISHWLANDRLYMLGYIRLTGELLRITKLPAASTPSSATGSVELRLVDWLISALVNIRREEKFFIQVAEKYGLDIDCIVDAQTGAVHESKKIEGLKRFERLFDGLTAGGTPLSLELPWLEGVVLFWATETVYHEAWLWAKARAEKEGKGDPKKDQDGGAMRKEFIPNWTNEEFGEFVAELERIIDEGVAEFLSKNEGRKDEVVKRAEDVWKRLLDAEEAFWPEV